MQLFYNETLSPEKTHIFFEKEESTHIYKVLRKKIGDNLSVTDGKGNLYTGRIQEISEKKCTIVILSSQVISPLPYQLHLAVAPTKMNERYEWFLEKATEIGIGKITPIICDHSERKTIKKERFEKIIVSAMKQSLHCHKPILNDPINMLEWLEKEDADTKFIAHCGEGERFFLFDKLHQLPAETRNITILIGPEGDFSPLEIKKAIEKKFIPVALSDYRLRTETAAIVACNGVADAFSLKK